MGSVPNNKKKTNATKIKGPLPPGKASSIEETLLTDSVSKKIWPHLQNQCLIDKTCAKQHFSLHLAGH